MPFVVDASIAAAWCLDENDARAEFAINRIGNNDQGHAPVLFWYELQNAILVAIRHNRLTREQARSMLDRIDTMAIALDPLPDGDAILDIAIRHRLTFYDAAYLELAMRHALPLATLDAALARAATAENVRLVGPP